MFRYSELTHISDKKKTFFIFQSKLYMRKTLIIIKYEYYTHGQLKTMSIKKKSYNRHTKNKKKKLNKESNTFTTNISM